ncbi:hypothetical protein CENSYa_1894 [Cenarchaeum symbiosum A]|uniref:Uncharacterized protein n=1 Tax=Cenarchaeum symbiosum (strain A) TaxID=414004 RepID=A0RYT6_CENSY|nr:hypothetical protein CENSYa_1894 [Cenarchaeum symbiosum A]
MGVHNNIHIPSESWPGWIWYAIEFAIVLAVSMVAGMMISDQILGIVAGAIGHGSALESWDGISVHSPAFKALDDAIEYEIVSMSNWIFYCMVGAVFGAWYVIIRGVLFNKRIFR